MVEKLTLMGHHEWRSSGLIDPPDDFLNGSFFADFIGSYGEMPRIVRISKGGSPWFIDPDLVTQVDFRVIGHRSAQMMMGLLTKAIKHRRAVADTLVNLELLDSSYRKSSRTFDQHRSALWPTYVFTIEKNHLHLTDGDRVTR